LVVELTNSPFLYTLHLNVCFDGIEQNVASVFISSTKKIVLNNFEFGTIDKINIIIITDEIA
jgi:hypothetical protein